MLKTCHEAVSKPNRNSLWGLGRSHGKARGTPSQAAAEGFGVQRLSKAAVGLLKLLMLLRGAQNVPRSSFEARYPIDQVRQFPAEKIIPYLRQNNYITISLFSPYLN